MLIRLLLAAALALAASFAHAQALPAVNTPMPGCSDGENPYYASGALSCGGGTPTLGSCGAGSPSFIGSDLEGRITTGTGLLSNCTLNFSHTLTAVPKCVATTSSAIAVGIGSVSATAITFTAVAFSGATIWYRCWGAI